MDRVAANKQLKKDELAMTVDRTSKRVKAAAKVLLSPEQYIMRVNKQSF